MLIAVLSPSAAKKKTAAKKAFMCRENCDVAHMPTCCCRRPLPLTLWWRVVGFQVKKAAPKTAPKKAAPKKSKAKKVFSGMAPLVWQRP